MSDVRNRDIAGPYLSLGLTLSILGLLIDGISIIYPILTFLGVFLTFFGLPLISRYVGAYYRRSHDVASIILLIIYVLVASGLITVATIRLIGQLSTSGLPSTNTATSEISNLAFAIIGSLLFPLTYLIGARRSSSVLVILRAFITAIFGVFVISIIVSALTYLLISFIALVALVVITVMYVEFVRGFMTM